MGKFEGMAHLAQKNVPRILIDGEPSSENVPRIFR